MEKIYVLNWDYKYSRDMERDAFHIPFQNSDKASILFLNPRYKDKLPDKIYFNANFNVIREIDYPLTDINVPILSNRMLEIVEANGQVDMIKTNVIMLDDTDFNSFINDSKKINKKVRFLNSFQAITLMEKQENYFDFDLSEYEPNELNPLIPGYVKKMVLKVSNSAPPIFRIKEVPSKLFILESVKKMLEDAEIQGCMFEEVEVTRIEDNV